MRFFVCRTAERVSKCTTEKRIEATMTDDFICAKHQQVGQLI